MKRPFHDRVPVQVCARPLHHVMQRSLHVRRHDTALPATRRNRRDDRIASTRVEPCPRGNRCPRQKLHGVKSAGAAFIPTQPTVPWPPGTSEQEALRKGCGNCHPYLGGSSSHAANCRRRGRRRPRQVCARQAAITPPCGTRGRVSFLYGFGQRRTRCRLDTV